VRALLLGRGGTSRDVRDRNALSDFGLVAWSVSWEMDYVNLLKTLDRADPAPGG
jgi:hypothetical protein